MLEQDPALARVACETATTTGLVVVLGEVTTTAQVEIQALVRMSCRRHRLHVLGHGLRRGDLRRDGRARASSHPTSPRV